jgi:hypothetical protein
MADELTDLDEVTALIQMYIDGADGDAALLRRAFHPMATMMGRIGEPPDTYVPIDHFISMVEARSGLAGPNYNTCIRSIDITDDVGVAVLVETDYLGCDFVDYFTVARVDGRWQIVHKTFAHTGGEPPAAS